MWPTELCFMSYDAPGKPGHLVTRFALARFSKPCCRDSPAVHCRSDVYCVNCWVDNVKESPAYKPELLCLKSAAYCEGKLGRRCNTCRKGHCKSCSCFVCRTLVSASIPVDHGCPHDFAMTIEEQPVDHCVFHCAYCLSVAHLIAGFRVCPIEAQLHLLDEFSNDSDDPASLTFKEEDIDEYWEVSSDSSSSMSDTDTYSTCSSDCGSRAVVELPSLPRDDKDIASEMDKLRAGAVTPPLPDESAEGSPPPPPPPLLYMRQDAVVSPSAKEYESVSQKEAGSPVFVSPECLECSGDRFLAKRSNLGPCKPPFITGAAFTPPVSRPAVLEDMIKEFSSINFEAICGSISKVKSSRWRPEMEPDVSVKEVDSMHEYTFRVMEEISAAKISKV